MPGGLTLSDVEHKALKGWGTPEDRALSAGAMVKKGTQDQNFLAIVLKCRRYGEKGYPRPKIFWEVSLSVDIFVKSW